MSDEKDQQEAPSVDSPDQAARAKPPWFRRKMVLWFGGLASAAIIAFVTAIATGLGERLLNSGLVGTFFSPVTLSTVAGAIACIVVGILIFQVTRDRNQGRVSNPLLVWLSLAGVSILIFVILLATQPDMPSDQEHVAGATESQTKEPDEFWTRIIVVDHKQKAPLDLDKNPPVPVAIGTEADLSYTSDGRFLFALNKAQVALWTDSSKTVSYDGCATLMPVASDGMDKIVLQPGAIVCIRTNEGRVALLRLISGGTGKPGDLPRFNATVWKH